MKIERNDQINNNEEERMKKTIRSGSGGRRPAIREERGGAQQQSISWTKEGGAYRKPTSLWGDGTRALKTVIEI